MKTNSNIPGKPDQLKELNDSLFIPYNKSREEIWESLQQETINKASVTQNKILKFNFYRFTSLIAASLLILFAIGTTIRYYHHTVQTAPGEIQTFNLPDGSEVTLSPESEIKYYPLWWGISRKLALTGEAFFNVQKGNSFSVKSKRGITTVLGTSFDIYARKNNYKVVCFSGSVNVKSRIKNKNIILKPGEKAEINDSGEILFIKNNKAGSKADWLTNRFVFTAEPLQQVFDEIARQMNIKIVLQSNIEGSYSGVFPVNITPEEAINIVCKPFGLTVVKQSKRYYVIK